MHYVTSLTVILIASVGLQGCVAEVVQKPIDPRAARAEPAMGYLSKQAVPNSAVLSPPPPAPGSAAQALDDEMSRQYLAMQGSPRFRQAALDAAFDAPFDCALQVPISKEAMPAVYRLLRRSMIDVGEATTGAKDRYKRARPFMVNERPTCLEGQAEVLRKNGSYPSGHSAVGWAFALILAEISPEQAPALFTRGRSFAQSRVVCNVHWYSDTVEGITLASAAVARLHSDPAFMSDLALARRELAAVRAKRLPVTRDCKAEADALNP